jgi:putative transposase
VPLGLKRHHGGLDLHFITFSRYQRLTFLASAHARDAFLRVLEEVRRRYRFTVVGYVVMPEHVHLLISEPERKGVGVVLQVLKQTVARRLRPGKQTQEGLGQQTFWEDVASSSVRFWQKRYYDFNVWSAAKEREKLRYMHRNPVTRGLVESPELWKWSSCRFYAYREPGLVRVNEPLLAQPSNTAKAGAPTA